MNQATRMMHVWCCGDCSKREEVQDVGVLGLPSDDAGLPAGWTWQPYLSRRLSRTQPGRVDLALGCCAEHALEAAKQYGTPVKVIPLEG